MNRAFALFFALLYIITSVSAQDTLRIMSYNIRNCRGLDNTLDIQRTAETLKSSNADIFAIQEVDSATRRSNGIFIADTLAALCNMQACFSAAIEYDGGKYGLAILSKEPPQATMRTPLPGREERRTLLVTEFPKFIFACTHLSLNEEDRLASLVIIDSIAKNSQKPFFIAGDLNDNPQSLFIKRLSVNWDILSPIDECTFPADTPKVTIDYIATLHSNAQAIEKLSTKVIDEPNASDHRPILTTVIIE